MAGPNLAEALCAGSVCLGTWAALGGASGWLATYRMRSVERATGGWAEPPNERRYLWYAGAAVAWPIAATLALVGLASRRWTRTGRDCALIMLAHFTLALFGSLGVALAQDGPGDNPLPLVIYACVMVGAGALAAMIIAWKWAGARAHRLASEEPTGAPPGAERFAVYLASLAAWPVGFIAAALYTRPENVRVGTTAMRLSLGVLVAVVATVCVGLPVIAMALGTP